MTTRRRRQQRSILLSFGGISVGFLIGVAFHAAGHWSFELATAWIWLAVAAAVHTALWLVLQVGWDRHLKWDPHFLYLPWVCVIGLFSLFVYAFPQARVLIPLGFMVNLLFLVGIAGFLDVLVFSVLTAAGYMAAIGLLVRQGADLPLGYEAMMAIVVI
ncbi:MAG: hypothetical protein OEM62_11740, partial [Acidobacteriota bacterium]|nr:hypothetical protein [Acidobacteriota bacterium]